MKNAKAKFIQALAEPTALSWLGQLGLALRHLHGQRVLHRDVKSSNVFVCGDGTVRLGDFGLASALRAADDALRLDWRYRRGLEGAPRAAADAIARRLRENREARG